MDRPALSEREAALVAATRRELAARAGRAAGAACAPGMPAETSRPAAPPAPRTTAAPPGPPDAAERIAAILRAEQDASLQRKRKLHRFGLVIPAAVLFAALAWVAVAIWRYAKF